MNFARHEYPLVSVIVPMYNHELFIHDCLESVARQEYPRIELLVLDDGSRDGSFERAAKWAVSGATSLERCELRRQDNVGICRTLNELVRRSRGDYILPLASDDLLHQRAVWQLVDFHVTRCKSDDLLFSNVSLIDLGGRTLAEDALKERGITASRLAQNEQLLQLAILLRWGDPFQHQFYPRRFYDLIGGYDESVAIEDVYFATRAIALNKARFAPINSKKYRVRPDRQITPGVRFADYSAAASRKLAVDGIPRHWMPLVNLVNYRDVQLPGPYRWLLTLVAFIAFRSYSLLTR